MSEKKRYTPEEVVEIVKKLKEMGIVEIKLEGYPSSFLPQGHSRSEERRDDEDEDVGQCRVCGDAVEEDWHEFCPRHFPPTRRRSRSRSGYRGYGRRYYYR